MKRKILRNLEKIERKCVLCLMLAGFAAINTGFTEQEKEIPAAPIEIEETSTDEITANDPAENESAVNEPTAIAVSADGNLKLSEDDELALAYADVVEKSLGRDLLNPEEELEPIEEVVETEQGYTSYTQVMEMEATAYLPTDGSAEGITAMGIPATYGIVAVDPAVIPLGSRVYIPGYGEALAADTGGAIYGYRIDLCMEDYWQAMDFGRRNVTVFVLK